MSPTRTPKPRPSKADLTPQEQAARRNGKVALICAAAFFGMIGAAYAAVPLYKLFCQATGFDGTVRKAEAKPTKILDRKVTIRFDANIRELPWQFQTLQASQDIRIGSYAYRYLCNTPPGSTSTTCSRWTARSGAASPSSPKGESAALASTPARWITWMWTTSPRPSSRRPRPW